MATLKSYPIQGFKKDNFQDENLEQIQGNSQEIWNSIQNHPILKGRLITDISVSTSSTSVAHKLGKKPKGYFLASSSASVTIYTTGKDDKFLKITASGSATISLWVF